MSKLEDLLGKKKEVVPVLDLSKTIVNSKEEYKRLSEKVPDYKMRPIKVGLFKCFIYIITTIIGRTNWKSCWKYIFFAFKFVQQPTFNNTVILK